MNTPPVTGFAGTRPAFEFSAQGQDSRWQEWHVIDRRNGIVICECWPPQSHNLDDAIDSLAVECEVCTVGLETVEGIECLPCRGSGLQPDLDVDSDPPLCQHCEGSGIAEEVSEACQSCGRLGPDFWMTPLGKAELIVAELNALYPGKVGCGYCMTCGYGGHRSPECLHMREPTTEMLTKAVQRLRIEGVTA